MTIVSKTTITGPVLGSAHEVAQLLVGHVIREMHVAAEGDVTFIGFKLDESDVMQYLHLSSEGDDVGRLMMLTSNWDFGDLTPNPIIGVEEEVRFYTEKDQPKSLTRYHLDTDDGMMFSFDFHAGEEPTFFRNPLKTAPECDGAFPGCTSPTIRLEHNFFAETMRQPAA